ncbi:MAG: holo-[acyl-carrier-protein] synthase [Dehalococcoidia bacterium]|nr:holo-[acyl-carrier-protein] synthase [Dehalococcoidia bacterium]
MATGVDIIEIPRIAKAQARWGDRFLTRIFTSGELTYSRGRAPQLAARFAAKEAVMKALGTGVRGVGWKEIEVIREPGGPPAVRLHGHAAARASALGLRRFALSISHSREYAVAFVIADGEAAQT